MKETSAVADRLLAHGGTLQRTFPMYSVFVGDALACVVAGVVAGALGGLPLGVSLPATVAVAIITLALLQVSGSYESLPSVVEQIWILRSVSVSARALLPLAAMGFVVRPQATTALAAAVCLVCVFAGLTLSRTASVRRWRKRNAPRVVVCGIKEDALDVADKIGRDRRHSGQGIVGVITHEDTAGLSALPRLGSWDELVHLHHAGRFDEAVFSLPKSSVAAIPLSLRAANDAIPFRFVPDGNRPHALNRTPQETASVCSPMGPVGRGAKRALDIVLAVAALAVSWPLFLVLAVVIPLDSPGPFLFRQRRVGKDGRPFTMYKFRTLHTRTSEYAISPRSKDDPRITPVGRVLRGLSIDEIPQFINVLLGNMSVVGPRPEMPFIVGQYGELERARLAVKPGITGVWQLSPYRQYPIHEYIHCDLFYIQRQSVTLDLVLIVQTAFFAFRGI